MKKFIIAFSLGITLIFSMVVATEMGEYDLNRWSIGNEVIETAVEETGAINTVTAVVFDYRAYDTIGEAFVLFTAITGTMAVLRKPVAKKIAQRSEVDESEAI